MSTLKTSQLQVGMKVKDSILGVKGDVKVNKGEVLSQGHIDKLNKWNKRTNKSGIGYVDASNPKGIETESTLKSGSEIPAVIDHPELSPVVQDISKKKLGSSMRVPISFDAAGNVIRYADDGSPIPNEEELKKEEVQVGTTDNAEQKRKPGRPAKSK